MIRHFMRLDGNVALGRTQTTMTYVETGNTIHLDTDKPVEAKMVEDVEHNPGWREVDQAGEPVNPPDVPDVPPADASPAVHPDVPVPPVSTVTPSWPPSVSAATPTIEEPAPADAPETTG